MAERGELIGEGNNKGYLIFKIWQSLPYGERMFLSFSLVGLGFVLQLLFGFRPSNIPFLGEPLFAFLTGFSLLGMLIMFLGNLLLLARGFDNRFRFEKFKPDSAWETVGSAELDTLTRLEKRIREWDVSLLDISNARGGLLFFLILGLIIFFFLLGLGTYRIYYPTLALDALVLIVPHWITGTRSIDTRPDLILKVEVFQKAMKQAAEWLDGIQADPMLLLQGDHKKIPLDVKMRLQLPEHHENFLGMYCQIVLNRVQGTPYPYFYSVLVAKKDYGLQSHFDTFNPPTGVIKEFKNQAGVEIIIIRQLTTRTSGYHTKEKRVAAILKSGIELLRNCGK